MAFWNAVRTIRADRTVKAQGRVASREKLYRQKIKANVAARRRREAEQRQALRSAAKAALQRLESQGFPGAVKVADTKHKVRAAWPLGDFPVDGPLGESTVSRYYLFSTGDIADGRGRGVVVVHAPDEILTALGRLGAEPSP
jgi:hypothetical protein